MFRLHPRTVALNPAARHALLIWHLAGTSPQFRFALSLSKGLAKQDGPFFTNAVKKRLSNRCASWQFQVVLEPWRQSTLPWPHQTWRSKRGYTRRRCRRPVEACGRLQVRDGLLPSTPLRSQSYTFACDVVKQARVAIACGVRPFIFPDRQRLNTDAGVQRDVVGNVVHGHLGSNEMPRRSFEEPSA